MIKMIPPLLLFPQLPHSPGKIDAGFSDEFDAALASGFPSRLYNHDAVTTGELTRALDDLPDSEAQQRVILRGWMMPGEAYSGLHAQLLAKGYRPCSSPQDYEQAHYIPFSYPLTKEHAPRTAWIEGDNVDAAWHLYLRFHEKDAIIKDWVKSAKYRWKTGCFIPAQTDEKSFREIYREFRQERNTLFNRGVVLREFMPILERGVDLRGLPIVEEIRLFFWKGQIIVQPDPRPPSPMDKIELWIQIANRFSSPFITIDVARLTDGTWKIVEVGDGGVSGLPMGMDPEKFYANLWHHTTGEPAPAPQLQ